MKKFIIVVNVLFLMWLIAGISTGADNTSGAQDVGTAIGAGIIIALWAFVDVILGVLYLVTRKT